MAVKNAKDLFLSNGQLKKTTEFLENKNLAL